MVNNYELQLFISHLDRLKKELERCNDIEHQKSVQDEVIFFTDIVNQLNKDTN
jgi:hypothetical protein